MTHLLLEEPKALIWVCQNPGISDLSHIEHKITVSSCGTHWKSPWSQNVQIISSTSWPADKIPITLLAANSRWPAIGKHKGGLKSQWHRCRVVVIWNEIKKGPKRTPRWGGEGGWYKTERQHSKEQKVNTAMEGVKWIKGAYGERSWLRFQASVDE